MCNITMYNILDINGDPYGDIINYIEAYETLNKKINFLNLNTKIENLKECAGCFFDHGCTNYCYDIICKNLPEFERRY